MDKVLLLTAVGKFFRLQPLTTEEAGQVKSYLTSQLAFPDMQDSSRLEILEASEDMLYGVFVVALQNTINHSFEYRYGQ